MSQNKEVLEILESNLAFIQEGVEHLSIRQVLKVIEKNTNQALAILKEQPEPKCKTCGESRWLDWQHPKVIKRLASETGPIPKMYPCPDCKEQPPAGEFTKKVRDTWPTYTFAMAQEKVDLQYDQLKEALVIIDRSRVENKALRRPLEAAGFKVDGMLAVGRELIKQGEQIKRLEKVIDERKCQPCIDVKQRL